MFWIVVRPEAELEIIEAKEWYEKRSIGLGLEFVRAFEATLSVIQRDPEMYAFLFDDVRHVRFKRFPYAVCYRVGNETIRVLAVTHLSRDPEYWRDRS
jgi:plasmid stabilization system protein ParE